MSDLRVTRLRGRTAGSAPNLPDGVVVSGIGTFDDATESTSPTTGAVVISGGVGIAKSLHVGGNVSVAGTLTYEDVTNVDSIGIITARNSVKITGGDLTIGTGATVYNPTSNTLVVDTNGAQRVLIGASGEISIAGATGNSGQVLTSQGGSAPPSWTTISSAPEHTGIASGSITGGRTVCVADDGKLLAVTGFNEAIGTDTMIVNDVTYFALVYSTAADKYVFFYRDEADSNKGKAVVGTQSGTTITWGTPVQFAPNVNSEVSALYDSTNDKVAVLYRDWNNSNRGSVCVGSISGNSITFGSPVQGVTGAHSDSGSMEYSTFCYCPDSDNYAVIYNSSSGNQGWCRIGKYSGTNSSSWPNAPTQFRNGQAREIGAWYDTTANKLMIAYNDGNDSNHSKVTAGTIASDTLTITNNNTEFSADGTDKTMEGCHDSTTGKNVLVFCGHSMHGNALTIVPESGGSGFTFGTIYTFSAATTGRVNIDYNPNADKFLITYADGGSSDWPKSVIATLTGNELTFQTPYHTIGQYNADTARSSCVFNPDTKSFVTCFRKSGQANYFVQNIRDSNLTAGNYIGIANASYTNGQTASVATPGAICDAVTGLTVGTRYYAAADGAFGTTPDSANILVGNSVATNKMIVR